MMSERALSDRKRLSSVLILPRELGMGPETWVSVMERMRRRRSLARPEGMGPLS